MRAYVRTLQTVSITTLLIAACAILTVAESARASSHDDHERHERYHERDKREGPHIHAKPDKYERPYSSGRGIRDDFETYREPDRDYEDDRDMYLSDEPEDE